MNRWLALLLVLTLTASGLARASEVGSAGNTAAHPALEHGSHEPAPDSHDANDHPGGEHHCQGCAHPPAVPSGLCFGATHTDAGVTPRSAAPFSSRAAKPLIEPPAR